MADPEHALSRGSRYPGSSSALKEASVTQVPSCSVAQPWNLGMMMACRHWVSTTTETGRSPGLAKRELPVTFDLTSRK